MEQVPSQTPLFVNRTSRCSRSQSVQLQIRNRLRKYRQPDDRRTPLLERPMTARRLPIEQPLDTTELLYQRLDLIHSWYRGMIHPVTGMLEYTYVPQTHGYI